ncbi:MAG TPA: ribonuclease HII [Gammaproteobacteria bacterium]|nr:ribonuclease HII [Gammaproteobacteria bacterium]
MQWQTETDLIAGVDEAGRGPLAGPVVAAAVILDPARPITGLRDSKQLSADQRKQLAILIRERSCAWAVAWSDHSEIDVLNILQATMLAMLRAVAVLNVAPERVLVDGNRCPRIPYPVEAIVKGDTKVAAISAASILAKVERDAAMSRFDDEFPGYGFAIHKGYPTPAHLMALSEHGVCAIHRRTFGPVRRCLDRGT